MYNTILRKFSSAVEQDPYTVKVIGSIPITSTKSTAVWRIICQCMKQQLEHRKVKQKIKSLHLTHKKLKNFLNSGMDLEMFHTYRI